MIAHALSFVAVFVATFIAGTLVQAILHRRLGHHPRGRVLYATHLYSHHALYAKAFTASRYSAEEKSVVPLYILPGTAMAALAYALLPLYCAVASGLGALFTLGFLEWMHRQYHLDRPLLRRSRAFQRLQALHYIHHRHLNTNFAIVGFTWDRLLGTYRGPAEVESARRFLRHSRKIRSPWQRRRPDSVISQSSAASSRP